MLSMESTYPDFITCSLYYISGPHCTTKCMAWNENIILVNTGLQSVVQHYKEADATEHSHWPNIKILLYISPFSHHNFTINQPNSALHLQLCGPRFALKEIKVSLNKTYTPVLINLSRFLKYGDHNGGQWCNCLNKDHKKLILCPLS